MTEFYPRGAAASSAGCGWCRCLVEVWNCVHVDISSGTRIGSARGSATRRRSFAAREPVQLQLWVRIFCLQSRRTARCWAGPWAFYKLRDDGIVPLICPTCQNVFAGKASMPATPCYFAWGCFRYFSWSEHRVGLAAVFPDDDRRLACRAVARAQRPAFALRASARRGAKK